MLAWFQKRFWDIDLWPMIEKLRKIRDNEGVFVAVFTGLSKGFDYIS